MPLQIRTFGRSSASARTSSIVRFSRACRTIPSFVPRLSQLPVGAQRVVGRGGVLHVDPDEGVVLGRVRHDGIEVLVEEVVTEVQPEGRRLDADVRVEPAAKRVDRLAIGACDLARLVRVGDLLPEHVERRQLPFGVQLEYHPQRVVELLAGDVLL